MTAVWKGKNIRGKEGEIVEHEWEIPWNEEDGTINVVHVEGRELKSIRVLDRFPSLKFLTLNEREKKEILLVCEKKQKNPSDRGHLVCGRLEYFQKKVSSVCVFQLYHRSRWYSYGELCTTRRL